MSNTPESTEPESGDGVTPEPIDEGVADTAAIDAAIARSHDDVVLPEPHTATIDQLAAAVVPAAGPELLAAAPVVAATIVHAESVPDAPLRDESIADVADLAHDEIPLPPKPKGNRLFALAVVALGSATFAALFAVVVYVIMSVTNSARYFVSFVESPLYWGTTAAFAVVYALLALAVNRAASWVHSVLGWLVGALSYLAVVALTLVVVRAWEMTPAEAAELLRQTWLSPYAIVAGLIAREIPIWFGSWIARRGRAVAARNAQALETYEADIASGPLFP